MEKNDPNQFRFVEEAEDEIKITMEDIMKCHGISLQKRNKEQEGEALSYIGLSYYKLGKFEKALDFHQKHLELSEATNNSKGKRRANCNIGCVYKVMGDLPLALYHLEKAYDISKEREDRKAQARVCNNMANIYEMLMDTDKAVELHKERYDLATDLEDLHGRGKACVSLGAIYLVKQDMKQSLFYYEELLGILRAKLRIQDTLPDDLSDKDDDGFIDMTNLATNFDNDEEEEHDRKKEKKKKGKGLKLPFKKNQSTENVMNKGKETVKTKKKEEPLSVT